MRVKIFILLFAALLYHFSAFAVTLSAVADSFICSYSAEQNTNFGTDDLLIKNAAPSVTGSFSRKVYIKFSLASLGATAVTQAFLNLRQIAGGGDAVSGTQTFHVYGLNDLASGENWGETSITWANAPGNNTSSTYGMSAQATLLGTFTINGTGYSGNLIQFSNSNLINFLNSDTNDLVTFMVTRETYDSNYSGYIHTFASREDGATGPNLLLETMSVVPEYSSFLFATLGILFFVVYKKGISGCF